MDWIELKANMAKIEKGDGVFRDGSGSLLPPDMGLSREETLHVILVVDERSNTLECLESFDEKFAPGNPEAMQNLQDLHKRMEELRAFCTEIISREPGCNRAKVSSVSAAAEALHAAAVRYWGALRDGEPAPKEELKGAMTAFAELQ